MWPYYYAGTMGLVQRDGIHRLRHAKRYSGFHSTICVTLAWSGYIAGTGNLRGPDPREMAKSDCVVIWGTNAVHTQVNVMTYAVRARKERGAKIVVIDPYRNATAEQADMHLMLRPGTDGALACAVMHVLFRDGFADREYLARYTDVPAELEAHLQSRGPAWAAAITGLSIAEIEAFAHLLGERKRHYLRLGYGFSRSRNGSSNMHAAASIAAVTGAWQLEGGGAFHNNGAIFHWDKSLIEGHDLRDPAIRMLDQSRIGPVLVGEAEALKNGPPVTALLIQNTNPVDVAPELAKVHKGFAREDLFTCVHEQFMTNTARMADIVLPATMFTEHDDIYQAGGQQHILLGPKIVEAPGEARESLCDLRTGEAAWRRASRFRDDSARNRRLDAHRFRLVRCRDAGARLLDRLPAGFPQQSFPRWFRPSRWQVPLRAGLGRDGARWLQAAEAAGPCLADRGGHARDAVPHGDGTGAQLPQFQLHRNTNLDQAGRPAQRDAA